MNWYKANATEVLEQLRTNRKTGLSSEEASKRLVDKGKNEIQQKQSKSALRMFIDSFKEPLVVILIVAVIIAILSSIYEFQVANNAEHGLANIYEAIAISLIVMINGGLSFYQTRSAQKSLDALKNMRQPQVRILRDQSWTTVPATEIVPGDIISFKSGDFIEGDVRFIKTAELQVNESQLTGESDAIEKNADAIEDDVDLADRVNMGFSGSMVVNGNAIAVVVATGMDTELGKIADLMESEEEGKTPIERSVHDLSKKLMLLAGGIIVFTVGFELVKQFMTMGEITVGDIAGISSTAIAIAVASIPDAMPVVLSIVLTIGAKILAKSKGLIKSLNSVETLGATTYIASDKTGTLTKNEMTVTRFYSNRKRFSVEGNGYTPFGDIIDDHTFETAEIKDYQRFFEIAALNNEAEIKPDNKQNWRPFGNPTDVSLVVMARKAEITRDKLLEKEGNRDIDVVRVIPFDSTRKMMTVVIKEGDRYYSLTKGAPDVIASRTDSAMINDKVVPISEVEQEIEGVILDFANDALRTIAITQREVTEQQAHDGTPEELEQGLTFLGIAGIIDPPREEVKAAVEKLRGAAVHVVMITGDHGATAKAIAKRLRIIDSDDAEVIVGSDIEKMTDAELAEKVLTTRVYARVSPEHKQRIVKQLQNHKEIVAMTGDGINNAPALKAADIGIAMGINGTEVTKDAADLILLDDKFTTIEASVESGRSIFCNILNFMRHELTTNVAEVLSLLLGVVLINTTIGNVTSVTPTLTALMVLWVNMISDSMPSFALGYDEPEANMMNQKPRNIEDSILANGMLGRVLLRGSVMGGMVFLAFIWAAMQGFSVAQAQTVAFLTLVFGQLWHVYDARSANTLFDRNPFSNSRLTLAVGFAATSSVLVTLIPFFNNVMGTAPLSMGLYLGIILISSLPTFLISGFKRFVLKSKSKFDRPVQLER
ncbi:cation-transporting P-type ATPase [Lentilactobacillus sp. Marseille-Q4993]|uniref:cation-translocating P-type ATPase n=1 Tax=Lentilactobacillus sp. Marseille-Q4993 TaxID=3039492 RepID=UPI0024BC92BF|nr:cation-transporting P-type ATPase [Lentilactobacillus sp. Marseille-Q4993]